jgi:ubiquitin C-terminal hydrolase
MQWLAFPGVQRLGNSIVYDVLRRILGIFIPDCNTNRLLTNVESIVAETQEDDSIRVVGLNNLGNTCFMNSVLQALASSPIMLKYLYASIDEWENPDKDVPFMSSLLHCLYEIRHHKPSKYEWLWGSAYRPKKLFQLLCIFNQTFASYNQQDAHECLQSIQSHLLEETEEEKNERLNPDIALPLPLPVGSTIVRNPCRGILASQLTCSACHTARPIKHEVFTDISLPIPTAFQTFASKANVCTGNIDNAVTSYTDNSDAAMQHTYDSCHIDDCLRVYTTGEEISDVACANCRANTESLKTFKISQPLPPILCLHLSRLVYSSTQRRMIKIQASVAYPLRLDVAAYVESNSSTSTISPLSSNADMNKSNVYWLRAVVVHNGGSDVGHYTSYVRIDEDGTSAESRRKWVFVSDSSVRSCTEEQALAAQAFMLFYEI